MNITGAKLRQLESDGWVVASGLWTAEGHRLLLHRGESELFVTVTDEDQPPVAEVSIASSFCDAPSDLDGGVIMKASPRVSGERIRYPRSWGPPPLVAGGAR